jgi:hypothetical protein
VLVVAVNFVPVCTGNVACYAAVGAITGYASTGTLDGAVFGTFAGIAFGGISAGFNNPAFLSTPHFGQIAASGVAGGLLSTAGGGRFGDGFLGGGAGSFAGPYLTTLGPVTGAVAAAVAGGTAAELGGGKFANGAISGAFAYTVAIRRSSDNTREAESDAESERTTVEIRYGKIRGIPAARHAFIVATGPKGQQFGLRAGPSARTEGSGVPVSSGGDGVAGVLETQARNFDERFVDFAADVVATQTVLSTDQPFKEITAALSGFASSVDAARIQYKLLTTNSNAFAHQAVTVLGIVRPSPIVFAPGSNTHLPLPGGR